jgi:hypothetical protein
VDPRASLNDMEKRRFLALLGLELRPLGRPAHSQSLCRLHYPGCLSASTFRKYRILATDYNVFKKTTHLLTRPLV